MELFDIVNSKKLYPASASGRFYAAEAEFIKLYGDMPYSVFSVAGRSEICGNHTDHNRGKVLAASVSLDIIAFAARTDDGVIRIKSAGFPEDIVSLSSLDPCEAEKYRSSSLIRGVCDAFSRSGRSVGGFCAYTTSDIMKGSGLSSSAAFEDTVGTVLNYFYNGGAVPVTELALASQYAENVHFGKPCGLMDQIACAAGGLVGIDFENPSSPVTKSVAFDTESLGYSLYIVATGGSHATLNREYASIPEEMKKVASYFGQDALRGLTKRDILDSAKALRAYAGDRAILRAIHFIGENDRVDAALSAAERGDINAFLGAVNASGDSSCRLLQNYFASSSPSEQGISLACAVIREALGGDGAVRVHGGGFAGTVQAFVPREREETFVSSVESVFGDGCAHKLSIRPLGAVKLL